MAEGKYRIERSADGYGWLILKDTRVLLMCGTKEEADQLIQAIHKGGCVEQALQRRREADVRPGELVG